MPDAMQSHTVQFALAQALSAASPIDETLLDQLALLSPIEYGQARKQVAEKFRVPVSFLDKAIEVRKKQLLPAGTVGNGRPLELPVIALADAPVNGEALLNLLLSVLAKYVILPEHSAIAKIRVSGTVLDSRLRTRLDVPWVFHNSAEHRSDDVRHGVDRAC